MSERKDECPFSGIDAIGPYEYDNEDAARCFVQCEAQISAAIQNRCEYDDYKAEGEPKNCMADLETSHETLSFFANAVRTFVTVQECDDHGVEVGEFIYEFTCPYDSSVK